MVRQRPQTGAQGGRRSLCVGKPSHA